VIHVGCCGFALAHEKYFATFRCVEVDTSFYNLPKLETATRWRALAPAGFEFTLKAWQVITHRASSPTYKRTRLDVRDLEHCGEFGFNPTIRWAWDETFAVAKALRATAVLFQCPASFRPKTENVQRLKRFFEKAKRGRFQMAWEPRGEWDPELIAKLCRELDLVHVVDPLTTTPAVTGPLRYYRLQGLHGTRQRYAKEDLIRLQSLCPGRTPTYCFFNNVPMAGEAQRFKDLISG
jgi:uncharacterized protein YecE (DUF72 family)